MAGKLKVFSHSQLGPPGRGTPAPLSFAIHGDIQPYTQWIGLRENLQESPIFNGKIYGFL